MKAFRDLKCISFDFDDTLWPVQPTILQAEAKLNEWLQQHCPRLMQEQDRDSLRQHMLDYAGRHPEYNHDVSLRRLNALGELMHQYQYELALAEQAMLVFRQQRNQVIPFADTCKTLSLLREHYRLIGITNGNAQIEQTALQGYFDFTICASDVGALKPDPVVFERAIMQAEIEPAQMLHVGDHAEADVVGALRAGCRAVWFNAARRDWPGGQNPDAVIHCLAEMIDLLQLR
jgi:putative hydrolase of the HAD superfamily|tara:strand:+ start:23745 stop:24440 length:696 start_codon:yes stop_codon:yes gene_type:complete